MGEKCRYHNLIAAAEIGRNPVSKNQIENEQADAVRRDGRTVSRGQFLRGVNGDRENSFSLFSRPRAGLATLHG